MKGVGCARPQQGRFSHIIHRGMFSWGTWSLNVVSMILGRKQRKCSPSPRYNIEQSWVGVTMDDGSTATARLESEQLLKSLWNTLGIPPHVQRRDRRSYVIEYERERKTPGHLDQDRRTKFTDASPNYSCGWGLSPRQYMTLFRLSVAVVDYSCAWRQRFKPTDRPSRRYSQQAHTAPPCR